LVAGALLGEGAGRDLLDHAGDEVVLLDHAFVALGAAADGDAERLGLLPAEHEGVRDRGQLGAADLGAELVVGGVEPDADAGVLTLFGQDIAGLDDLLGDREDADLRGRGRRPADAKCRL